MKERVEPLGARVLVRVLEDESVTSGGLLIPDTAKEKPQRGVVMAIGDDEELIKVKPGDRVLYPRYAGTEVRVDGVEHLVIDATELLALLRDDASAGPAS
jgi:chaperonin GroES